MYNQAVIINNNGNIPHQYTTFIATAPLQLQSLSKQFMKICRDEYLPYFRNDIFNNTLKKIWERDQEPDNGLSIEETLLPLEDLEHKLRNLLPSLTRLENDIKEYVNIKQNQIPAVLQAIENSDMEASIKLECEKQVRSHEIKFNNHSNLFNRFMDDVASKFQQIKELENLLNLHDGGDPLRDEVEELLCIIHGGLIDDYDPYEDAIDEAVEILRNYDPKKGDYPDEKIKEILQAAYDAHNTQNNYTI